MRTCDLSELDGSDPDNNVPAAGVSVKDLSCGESVNFSDGVSPQSESAKVAASSYLKDRWKFSVVLSPEQVDEAKTLLGSIPMWEGIGCLNTGETLPMPIKENYKDKPCIQRPYPMSQSKREAYDEIIKLLEEQDIVEDSTATDYCSPALIVVQKGKPRFVVDFRKINERTPLDVYPLPRQSDIFNALQGSSFISMFDLVKAFFQMPIAERDRNICTFSTRHGGSKRLKRSLMGYTNSPAHCQRIIDRILQTYRWVFVIVYVDDIVVFSKSWSEHLEHIKWVLTSIHRAGLTLDASKSYIGYQSVNLLGHLVNRFGLSTQTQKIHAMMNLPIPKTLQDVRMLLGFFGYYRRFVRNFAQIVQPINKLLTSANLNKSDTSRQSFEKISIDKLWSAEHDAAFLLIKERLRDATYLTHSMHYPDAEYRLYVDACRTGFGAALHVMVPRKELPPDLQASTSEEYVERPVCFISRELTKSERNYWPTELEMAGLVWALRKLEEIVDSTNLVIYTDHSALTWLLQSTDCKSRNANQRLLLWILSLQKWKPRARIVHRPGRAHLNADTLSRYPSDIDTPEELKRDAAPDEDRRPLKIGAPPSISSLVNEPAVADRLSPLLCSTADDPQNLSSAVTISMNDDLRRRIVEGYAVDKHWTSLLVKLRNSSDRSFHSYKLDELGYIQYADPSENGKWKLCIPSRVHKEVFRAYHDQVGHPGFAKTYSRLASSFHMPTLSKRLRAYIRSCPQCISCKSKDRNAGLLHPLPLVTRAGDTIAMDFISGLPADDGHDAILTITDKFTKMVTLIPAKTHDDATKTANRFFHHYYPRHGIPRNIISDRDVRFVSKFWQALFKSLDCSLLMSSAYSPQTDGQSERTNQTLEVMLRTMIGFDRANCWLSLLPIIEFSINTQKSEASNFTPFEILYGTNPRNLADHLLPDKDGPSTFDEMSERRRLVQTEAAGALAYARTIMAMHYDEGRTDVTFSPGDRVYIENRAGLQIAGLNHEKTKVTVKRFGPFKVLSTIGAGACRLDLPSSYKMHPVVSNRHLTKAPATDEFNREDARPPPMVIDETKSEGEYEVESVIDKRVTRGRLSYLVKWLGYPAHESTWIASDQSHTFREAIQEYEARVSGAKARATSDPEPATHDLRSSHQSSRRRR